MLKKYLPLYKTTLTGVGKQPQRLYEATENDIAKEEDGSKDEAGSEGACVACNGVMANLGT